MTLLRVENVSKYFGGVCAVQDVSFTLNRGERLALIGPNGAGKTTCFNMLMGQTRADGGRVFFRGQDITGLAPRNIWPLGVGRTFQITGVYLSMSVLENVQTALFSVHGETFNLHTQGSRLHVEAALELLAQVGMTEQAHRPASVLAYGDLKRLELAIALAGKPMVLLLDEPTAGMAPAARATLMEMLCAVAAVQSISLLFTEHDMKTVFAYAERVLVMDKGRIIAVGTPDAVRADHQVRQVYLGADGDE